ncbi:hypothetical protein [Kitasatospora sp. NBC_01302]|uniref:hypothetical protein n=1 Tax=Kitasatospora sp. NBC_01302 TaxID=2903575 RepID=UPI002E11FF74|nr:hypothetical protein OG294_01665 [Kitasatospora sp. NBC_01302]
MLAQELAVLAAAGGTAVVQAAGTDVWAGLRQAVARWFGRGDELRERAELERLDQAAGELESAGVAGAERVRIRQEAAWQTRIEAVLESLDGAEQARAAEELRALLAQHAPFAVSVGDGGQAVVGDVRIRADHGSAAAWTMGNVTLGNPSQPGPQQG